MLARQGILTLADLQAALDDERIGDGRRRARGDGSVRPPARSSRRAGRSRSVARGIPPPRTSTTSSAACSGRGPLHSGRRGQALRTAGLVDCRRRDGRPTHRPPSMRSLGRATVLHRSGRRAILMSREGEIDVRVAAPDEYGTVLFTATGSRAHLNAMRQRRGRPKLAAREEDVYGQAGLPFHSGRAPSRIRGSRGRGVRFAAGR